MAQHSSIADSAEFTFVEHVQKELKDVMNGKNTKVLNVLEDSHGFVQLTEMMPRMLEPGQSVDDYIANIARTSYADGTKKLSDNKSLVRYLLRNKHTSPFEFVKFVFLVRAPIPIRTQIFRHRTFAFNEESARYSVIKDHRYLPPDTRLTTQSKNNKQGSSDQPISKESMEDWHKLMNLGEKSCKIYTKLVETDGMNREVARFGLPQNMYTKFYGVIDLHNLSHFLKLRMDKHAQYEVRRYANAIYEILKGIIPDILEAYEDYLFSAVTFSRLELESIAAKSSVLLGSTNEREKSEYSQKLKDTGLCILFTQ